VLWLLLVFATVAYCTHVYLYTFEEQIRYAEVVCLGRIASVKKSWFGFGYVYVKLPQVEFLKGKADKADIQVRYGRPFYEGRTDPSRFAQGEQYLLFLKGEGQYYSMVGPEYRLVADGKVETSRGLKWLDEVRQAIATLPADGKQQ
jgi:hypothetical protein